MRDESGILVNASPGCCSFLHLTFQEYLAATHAVEECLAGELVKRLDKSWWREVILLALARANGPFAKEFFAAFLESPAWEADLNLAARCLDEAAVTILDPFVDRLKSREAPKSQKIRILRMGGLPVADGGGMGVRVPCGHNDGVSLRGFVKLGTGELQREPSVWESEEGSVSEEDKSGGELRAECVWLV